MEQITIARPAPPLPARPAARALHEAGPRRTGAPYEAEIPRPEHPRPDFQRDTWINLNGRWRFTFDPRNLGEQQRWYRVPHPLVATYTGEVTSPIEDPFGGEIIVPFPWESRLSGVCDPSYKGAAWYQRSIVVPAEWASLEPAPPSASAPWIGMPRSGSTGGLLWSTTAAIRPSAPTSRASCAPACPPPSPSAPTTPAMPIPLSASRSRNGTRTRGASGRRSGSKDGQPPTWPASRALPTLSLTTPAPAPASP